MLYSESPLEQTQRHVTEGGERIAKQEALIEHLRQEGGENHPLLADARKLLADMHEFQELGQEHLEREKAKEV